MKLKINIIACLLCAALLGVSCVKDKGNYDYTDANGVLFEFDENYSHDYQMLVGDILEITPPIETVEPFSYEWWLVDKGDVNKLSLISTDKTLEYRVGDTDRRSIVFRMKNNRTGVWYTDPTYYTVSATTTLARGFIFLTKKGTGIGIDMYSAPVSRYQPEYTLLKDVHLLPDEADRIVHDNTNGYQIVAMNNATGIGNILTYTTLLLTDKGSIRLSGNFGKIGEVNGFFAGYSMYSPAEGMTPTRISCVQSGTSANIAAAALRWNNNWFSWIARSSTSSRSGSRRFENAINVLPTNYNSPVGNEVPVEDLVAVTPATSSSSPDRIMMWSDAEKKFLVKSGNGTPQNATNDVTSKFLVDNPTSNASHLQVSGDANFSVEEPTRTVLWMNSFVPNSRSMYAIVRDPVGYRYLRFSADGEVAVKKEAVATFSTTGDISDPNDVAKVKTVGNQKLFAATQDFLYYATTDNEVHSMKHANGEMSKVTSINIPAGHEVVGLRTIANNEFYELAKINYIYVITKDPAAPEDSCCTLTVYSREGQPSDEVVVVEYDELHWNEENQVNDIVKAPMIFSGLGDVISFSWKER